MSEKINPADCEPYETYEGTAGGERFVMMRARPGHTHPWVWYKPDCGLAMVSDHEVSELVLMVPETEIEALCEDCEHWRQKARDKANDFNLCQDTLIESQRKMVELSASVLKAERERELAEDERDEERVWGKHWRGKVDEARRERDEVPSILNDADDEGWGIDYDDSDDPDEFIILEGDLGGLEECHRNEDGDWEFPSGRIFFDSQAPGDRDESLAHHREQIMQRIAVIRAIEAEQDDLEPDPDEGARRLWDVSRGRGGKTWEELIQLAIRGRRSAQRSLDQFRRMASAGVTVPKEDADE